jgi:hypothetical protein
MKKKILMILAMAMFMFGVAGQAMAYFDDGHLVRVVYDRGGDYEVVTDLGAGWNKESAYTGNHLFNTNNFSLSQLDIPSWDTVYVAYFTRTVKTAEPDTANHAWSSGPETGQSSLARKWSAFGGNAGDIMGGNYSLGNPQNVNSQGVWFSYSDNFGTEGRFAGFLPSPGTGDKSLAALNAPGSQYVDQWLYYYASPDSAASGVKLYQIRTYENGTTEINPIPIPAAVYLLGSGLLGLIGIRRRMVA